MRKTKTIDEGDFCDKCGIKITEKNTYNKSNDRRYMESKHGDGINLTIHFETEYRWVERSGKTRRTQCSKQETSDLCNECAKKILDWYYTTLDFGDTDNDVVDIIYNEPKKNKEPTIKEVKLNLFKNKKKQEEIK